MKKTLPWLIAGLVVFVTLYAFIFPESQLPVRIKTEVLWNVNTPTGEIFYEFENFTVTATGAFEKINDEWGNIGLPEFPERAELPAGLSWSDPVITGVNVFDGDLTIAFPNNKSAVWDGSWKWEINPNKKLDFEIPLKNQEESISEILKIGSTSKLSFGEKTISAITPEIISDWEKSDIQIGKYIYKITEDGRIERIREELVTAISDRTELDPFVVPKSFVADGKNLFVLMKSLTDKNPEKWVQVLSSNLQAVDSIISNRNSQRPVSICLWNTDTLLVLWNDGVLSGHTLWGQGKFQFQICQNNPLDMVSAGENIFVLTNSNLLRITLSTRDSDIDVWPRILRLGNISEKKEFSVYIGTDSVPRIQVKGDGIELVSIMGKREGMLATFSISPSGLSAFSEQAGELLVETESGHEIVPYSFVPFGSVDELRIFSDGLLNLETGEWLDYTRTEDELFIPELELQSVAHRKFYDFWSGTVYVLRPPPLTPLN